MKVQVYVKIGTRQHTGSRPRLLNADWRRGEKPAPPPSCSIVAAALRLGCFFPSAPFRQSAFSKLGQTLGASCALFNLYAYPIIPILHFERATPGFYNVVSPHTETMDKAKGMLFSTTEGLRNVLLKDCHLRLLVNKECKPVPLLLDVLCFYLLSNSELNLSPSYYSIQKLHIIAKHSL